MSRFCFPCIGSNDASAVGAINKLQGVVAIHCSKKFKFQLQFIHSLVEAWGAYVLDSPFTVLVSKFDRYPSIGFSYYCQVAIIGVAKLIGEIRAVWYLIHFMDDSHDEIVALLTK